MPFRTLSKASNKKKGIFRRLYSRTFQDHTVRNNFQDRHSAIYRRSRYGILSIVQRRMNATVNHNPSANTSNRYRDTARKKTSHSLLIITNHLSRPSSMFAGHVVRVSFNNRLARPRSVIATRRQKGNLHAINSVSLLRGVSKRVVTQMTGQHLSGRSIRLHLERLVNARLLSKILNYSRSRQLQRVVNSTIGNSFLLFRGLRGYKLHLQQYAISFVNRRSKNRGQSLTRLRFSTLLVMRDRARRVQERRVKHRLGALRANKGKINRTSNRLNLANTKIIFGRGVTASRRYNSTLLSKSNLTSGRLKSVLSRHVRKLLRVPSLDHKLKR